MCERATILLKIQPNCMRTTWWLIVLCLSLLPASVSPLLPPAVRRRRIASYGAVFPVKAFAVRFHIPFVFLSIESKERPLISTIHRTTTSTLRYTTTSHHRILHYTTRPTLHPLHSTTPRTHYTKSHHYTTPHHATPLSTLHHTTHYN